MAYRTEKNGEDTDIVIDGWEKGIADAPELGLGSIQGANITSMPGEISVSPSTVASTIPPVGQISLSYSVNAATDVFTVASTAGFYNGMGINILTTSTPLTVQTLVVAGGGAGGGGTIVAAGGGAGGFQYDAAHVLTNGIGAYPIVIGAGAIGSSTFGASGASSSFDTITSIGGGGGGGSGGANGNPGGSGGGASGVSGTGTGGAGTVGQGNDGGGSTSAGSASGGGGGAGAVGQSTAVTNTGGSGGVGLASSISGSSVFYAGGGGGGGQSVGGAAGNGGGGGGVTPNNNGLNATVNTGGGGGAASGSGGSTRTGGNGGSGIVIISYTTGSYTATGGTITTSGGNTIHTFTANGTFTVTAMNIVTPRTYYVGNITGTTFKLYYDITLNQVVNLIANATGTYTVPSFGIPIWSTQNDVVDSATGILSKYTFLLDTSGNAWYVRLFSNVGVGGTTVVNSLQYAGNLGHSSTVTAADFGIVIYLGYLFAVVGTSIDYLPLSALFQAAPVTWIYGWKTDLNKTQYQHQAIAATDDAVYICNGQSLASILENAGTTFDPSNSATYSYNTTALLLPQFDQAQCIAQLGVQLLVGGVLNYIYPWDRVSTSFTYPLTCSDSSIKRIVSTNSNAYVFAGQRGRIYITNGSQVQLYKKITDSLSGNPEAYYNWQDALYLRNKMYFTFTATDNAGTTLNTFGGLWTLGLDAGQTQIDLSTAGSLYNSNQLSYGTYGGSCPVLFYNQLDSPAGYGICAAWTNGGINNVDISTTAPYTSFQTVIQTDIIPVGTYYTAQTDRQIEYKLSKPLVAGETIRISWRGNLTDAFTTVWTSTATGKISDAKQVNFQKQQWVQFQIEMSSTVTNPTYVRLRELRIR